MLSSKWQRQHLACATLTELAESVRRYPPGSEQHRVLSDALDERADYERQIELLADPHPVLAGLSYGLRYLVTDDTPTQPGMDPS